MRELVQRSGASFRASRRSRGGVLLGVVSVGLATLIAVASFAASVSAQEDRQRSIERAREHMERGQALYLQARFEEAASEFESAYEAEPFSAFLYNAGVALERAGQASRAIELFERYLERDPAADDAEGVRERMARLRAALDAAREAAEAASAAEGTEGVEGVEGAEGQPDRPGPTVAPTEPPPDALPDDFKSLLSVRTNPEGAEIRVRRGEQTVAEGPAPFAHTLDQGRYLVTVSHPDFQTVEQEVRIEPGKVYVIIVEMSQGEFLGYLRVASDIPGAQVFIDDRDLGPRGQTPFEGPIAIGEHRVWIERPGYEVEEVEVEVGIGQDVTVRVDLTRVDYGRLRVVANIAGARVLVDGELVGTVPFEGQVDAGLRRVRIEADGRKAFEQDVTIERGQLTPVRARLRPDVDRAGAWVWSFFSAGFIGGGIALGVLTLDLQAELELARDQGTLAVDDPRLDQGIFMSIGANSAFLLAVIFGAVALFSFVNDPLPPSEGRALEPRDWAFAPFFDPSGQGGLAFEGRF